MPTFVKQRLSGPKVLLPKTSRYLFAQAGHEVVFSYSRSRQKLEQLAKDAGKNAHAGTPADATRNADAVLLAVHWTRVDDVLAQAGVLSGTRARTKSPSARHIIIDISTCLSST